MQPAPQTVTASVFDGKRNRCLPSYTQSPNQSRYDGLPPRMAAIVYWHMRPLTRAMHSWTAFALLLSCHILLLDCLNSLAGISTGLLWLILCVVWTYRFVMRLVVEFAFERRAFHHPGWDSFTVLPFSLIGMWLFYVLLFWPDLEFAARLS